MYSVKSHDSREIKSGRTNFLFQGTRHCIHCDVTHKEMKEKMNGLVIDRDLVKEALKGNDSSLEIVLTIKYQGIRLQRDQ